LREPVPAALLLVAVVAVLVAANPSFGTVGGEYPVLPTAAAMTVPGLPAEATPASPSPQVAARHPLVTSVPEVEAHATPSAVVAANELGRVPILMYHAFVHVEANSDKWTLTFDQFRSQLDWLREHDFVMVGMRSMVDGRFDVPAGKRPAILTFDDSSPRQYGLQAAAGGGYDVRPDTAVGVLEAYRKQYPEFVGPAFFAVLPFNCFASEDDPSTCEERLSWLVEHGYEIGNHTSEHVALTDVAPEVLTRAIGEMAIWIDARVPEGTGNLSHVLVLPFGAYPASAEQRQWLHDGFWYLGEPVQLELVLAVNGGPAAPPYADVFAPVEVPRFNAEPELFTYWAEQIETSVVPIFVSDGDPDTVTVPADLAEAVNTGWLEKRDLDLRTYEADHA